MNNNMLVMREEEMESLAKGLEKNSIGMENASTNMKKNFSGLENSGLFGTGLNTINKQVKSVSTSLLNVNGMIKKHSGEMFNMDVEMAKKADSMEIPQDFVKNNSMQANSFYDYMLEKTDGKSVNAGQESTNTQTIVDSTIINAENLNNIKSDTTLREEKINDDTGISVSALNNIKNDNGMNEQKLSDIVRTTSETLKNINKNETITEQNISNETGIANQTLSSINNDSVNKAVFNAEKMIQENLAGVDSKSVSSNANIENVFNNIKSTSADLLDTISNINEKIDNN